jgi:hypothetical protein
MILKFFFKLFLFSVLAVAQLSFVSGLPFWLREANLLIIFLIFFLEINSGPKTVWWFVLVGFIFGLYRSFFFSFFLLFWPAVFVFCRLIYSDFLTNRSLYSFLGLTVLTTWFYYFLLNSAAFFAGLLYEGGGGFFLFSGVFWMSLAIGSAVNSAAVFLIFQVINLATDRLKPVFIFRRK